MRVGRENEVVLLGAISPEFCAMCTSVGMGLLVHQHDESTEGAVERS